MNFRVSILRDLNIVNGLKRFELYRVVSSPNPWGPNFDI